MTKMINFKLLMKITNKKQSQNNLNYRKTMRRQTLYRRTMTIKNKVNMMEKRVIVMMNLCDTFESL